MSSRSRQASTSFSTSRRSRAESPWPLHGMSTGFHFASRCWRSGTTAGRGTFFAGGRGAGEASAKAAARNAERARAKGREGSVMPRSLSQAGLQAGLDGRPFLGDDAVDDGVAYPAVGALLVAAQHPFPPRPELLDRPLAVDVVEVGLELHALGAQRLEGVAQEEVLRLRVDASALVGAGDPGAADLQTVVGGADLEVSRGAHRLSGRLEHG